MRCLALIVAGGHGARFGAAVPKQYLALAGQPLLRRTVSPFLAHAGVDAVQVVIRAGDEALYREAVAGLALLPPAIGGDSRQESVRRGLESAAERAPATVLIHDAARPMTTAAVISRVIAALEAWPAAVPALPVHDTLKREAGPAAPPLVAETVERAGLWRAQTPQGFRFAAILEAHRRLAGVALTDDAALAERAGLAVAIVPGDEDNMKVTTREDLERAARRLAGGPETRVGFGFDVHRFTVGDHVMLGGVRVPHGAGLAGHSDADVVLHALTDALLGAVAAGDIGQHFPPGEPQWRGAASEVFVRRAMDLVGAAGGSVASIDVTVIAERPRIGPYRIAMIERIAAITGIAPGRISIKATTTEKLGFTGRGEGIAAQVAVAVRLPGSV